MIHRMLIKINFDEMVLKGGGRRAMQIIDLNQAKLHLPELIEQTMSGDDIVITQDGKALVKLVALVKPGKKTRQFGGAEDSL